MGYDLTLQKRLASDVLDVGTGRVVFEPARLNDIKQAITKEDIRILIDEGAVTARPKQGISRARARKRDVQRSKGMRKGPGNRKGTASARRPSKRVWMDKVRSQRKFLKELKDKGILDTAGYRELYAKSKGGFFRSIRHIKLVMNERGLAKEEKR